MPDRISPAAQARQISGWLLLAMDWRAGPASSASGRLSADLGRPGGHGSSAAQRDDVAQIVLIAVTSFA
jgi:hypothetical protein